MGRKKKERKREMSVTGLGHQIMIARVPPLDSPRSSAQRDEPRASPSHNQRSRCGYLRTIIRVPSESYRLLLILISDGCAAEQIGICLVLMVSPFLRAPL